MSKIIVGVDDSERATDAVALAARLARGTGATLVLACAYPYGGGPVRGANASFEVYLREDAEAAIERARASIADLPGVHAVTVADVSPARALQQLAEREGGSLIVIGSSHRGAVGRVLAGTTAERLLHGAPCPVAVAPKGFAGEPGDALRTIAVAYDRSPEATAALDAAAALARSAGARLRIVEVLNAVWFGTMGEPAYVAPPAEVEQRARRELEAVAAPLDAEAVLLTGDPEHELAGETERADLMVCGSRGYGPRRAVLVGSVSGRLVRDSACPVLVVPRGVDAPLEDLLGAAEGVA